MKRPRRSLLVALGCLTLTTYFVYHAINGKHGLDARSRLVERSSMLESQTRSLEAVRRALQRDVALLAAEPPDRDLIEEIARDLLGLAPPGAIVVPHTP
jgi:cell division protein FtsB